MTILLENNYFENITNNVTEFPMIILIGEDITVRNTTVKNSLISTVL